MLVPLSQGSLIVLAKSIPLALIQELASEWSSHIDKTREEYDYSSDDSKEAPAMICLDQLGKGTFGTVYLGHARDATTKDAVAIKRNKCRLGSSFIFVVRETDLLK